MSSLPRFPIYIPSKSRADSRLTMRALDLIGVTYRVIIEAQQFDDYAAVIPQDRLLVLDERYQAEYDTFDALGRSKSLGPGPARNMAWADSMQRGFDWHWVMDDNIQGFYWLWHNHRPLAGDAGPLVAMEDFTLRYSNIGMAGPNYLAFAKARQRLAPFVTGTRIYSCNLIRNDVALRWRGRYNEDTDLSLRMLKAGWNTVQFNAFLANKIRTQTMRGGNTEAFYAADGTTAKSAMLVAMHPDCARLHARYGRIHHFVDYSAWRERPLITKPDAEAPRVWNAELVPR